MGLFAGRLIYSDRWAGCLGCCAGRLFIRIACLVILDVMLVG